VHAVALEDDLLSMQWSVVAILLRNHVCDETRACDRAWNRSLWQLGDDDRGKLRPVPNVQLAARMVLETVALWAIHMPWDASPRPFAEDAVEDAVVDMLVHAYAKEKNR
jgi:hypothetical protein